MKKKLLAMIIITLTILVITAVSAGAATYSGTCGDNAAWSLDTGTGVLNITGSGEMTDYDYFTAPWYNYFSFIKTVNISGDITSIGDFSFFNHTELENVTFGENSKLKDIGNSAFYSCSITAITLPSGVTSIGNDAFCGCHRITDIELPSGLLSIGNGAFDSCTALTDITIPSSVTDIGMMVFYLCDGLNSITVESGNPVYKSDGNCLIKISSNRLIQGCSSSIIPDYITSIDGSAFYGCDRLTSITIPQSVTSIGNSALSGYIGLASITVESGNPVYKSDGNCIIGIADKSLVLGCKNSVIPDYIKSIGAFAFDGCSGLTSVTIPSGVTYIDGGAFIKCSGLASITIPSGVTYIGDYAFAECGNLTSITIPDSIRSIGCEAFSNTGYYLDASNWENDVLYIGKHLIRAKNTLSGEYAVKNGTICITKWAFYLCTGVTGITIPDSVVGIGEDAFELTGYYMNDSNWENNALYIGKYLVNIKYPISEEYTIKDGTLCIADTVFKNHSELKNVTIPSSVTTIGKRAFEECDGLLNITIPAGVNYIGLYAFDSCIRLESITVENGNTVYKSDENCLIGIADNLLIRGCNNSVIPDYVTNIGEMAFNGARFETIIIPSGITSIGQYAFEGNINLNVIYFMGKQTEWQSVAKGLYAISSGVDIVFVSDCEHDYTESVIPPACTEKGYTRHTCSICTYFYDDTFVDARHTWGGGTVTLNPTVTTTGTMKYVCTVCSAEKTEEIPVLKTAASLLKDDSIITIDPDTGYARGIKDKKNTVSEVLEQFSDASNIKIVDKNGKTLTDNDKLGTGSKIQIIDSTGKVVDEVTVIIKGDVNGDGIINVVDGMKLRAQQLGKTSDLDGAFLQAGLDIVPENVSLGIVHYMKLRAYQLGKTNEL